MKWVTRERAKVDRIACPWLFAQFIDDEPEFLYVPPNRVLQVAEAIGAWCEVQPVWTSAA